MCDARQYSDQMLCNRCGLQWDVNDPDPPCCAQAQPTDDRSRRVGEQWLKRITAMLQNK